MSVSDSTLLQKSKLMRLMLAAVFLCSGFVLWLIGAQDSVLLHNDRMQEQSFIADILIKRAPDYHREKALAEAYWARYPDVRKHRMWGQGGVMGIKGPRDHYELHGKKEGRVWGRVE